ncbi:MAG TPA: PHP domain-containing protein, partial [Kiloniellales bacterium]|nr:PHP domain-containing protein [Kiloniellales bacterium]
MAHAGFVHLRVHSAYSLLEGALKIPQLIELCREQAMPAVAVTDSSNLFGALEFAGAAREAGIQPIIGCQLGLSREPAEAAGNGPRPAPDSLPLLVQSETGYRNLMKLVSAAFLETPTGEAAQVDLERLACHAEGLIAFTGGPAGPVGRHLLEDRDQAAEEALARLEEIFPGRLYVELLRHGLPEETTIEERLLALAYDRELPLVATNECFFADAGMYEAHDALICIAEGTYVGEQDRRRLTVEHRFKSAEEMAALFDDLPEAVENTLVVAQRCAYMPQPVAPILPAFPTEGGRSEAEELRVRARAGLERRLETQVFGPESDPAGREATARLYRERQDYELAVIEQMGYPGYF